MRRVWSIVIFASACYAPAPITGAPCAANGDCPDPLVCDRSKPEPTCEASLHDGGPDDQASPDVPLDTATDASVDAGVDAGLVLCIEDDFNDGSATDWTIVDPSWVVQAGAGPDSSFAFLAPTTTGDAIITHPAIRSITSARISLDVRIDNSFVGDFSLYLVAPGWVDPNDGTNRRYFTSLYAVGSDSAPDRLAKHVPPAAVVETDTHPVSLVAGTWRHVDMVFRTDGSIRIDLDQVLYMDSPPDSEIPPPFDLIIRFWGHGAIDNVRIECTH